VDRFVLSHFFRIFLSAVALSSIQSRHSLCRGGVERRRLELKGVEGGYRNRGVGGEMRREKSLRIGVHHANAVVWGPVYRTRLASVSTSTSTPHRSGALPDPPTSSQSSQSSQSSLSSRSGELLAPAASASEPLEPCGEVPPEALPSLRRRSRAADADAAADAAACVGEAIGQSNVLPVKR
jgi:hypothetical protein